MTSNIEYLTIYDPAEIDALLAQIILDDDVQG